MYHQTLQGYRETSIRIRTDMMCDKYWFSSGWDRPWMMSFHQLQHWEWMKEDATGTDSIEAQVLSHNCDTLFRVVVSQSVAPCSWKKSHVYREMVAKRHRQNQIGTSAIEDVNYNSVTLEKRVEMTNNEYVPYFNWCWSYVYINFSLCGSKLIARVHSYQCYRKEAVNLPKI